MNKKDILSTLCDVIKSIDFTSRSRIVSFVAFGGDSLSIEKVPSLLFLRMMEVGARAVVVKCVS